MVPSGMDGAGEPRHGRSRHVAAPDLHGRGAPGSAFLDRCDLISMGPYG